MRPMQLTKLANSSPIKRKIRLHNPGQNLVTYVLFQYVGWTIPTGERDNNKKENYEMWIRGQNSHSHKV